MKGSMGHFGEIKAPALGQVNYLQKDNNKYILVFGILTVLGFAFTLLKSKENESKKSSVKKPKPFQGKPKFSDETARKIQTMIDGMESRDEALPILEKINNYNGEHDLALLSKLDDKVKEIDLKFMKEIKEARASLKDYEKNKLSDL
jgi:hypothetical protein